MNSTVCQTPPSQGLLSAELRSLINERNILTTKTRIKVLSDLDDVSRDTHRLKQDERERHLRANAIQEILTSEASYLQQLETIMKFFMEPLRVKDFVSQAEWNALFGNVETLYKVNGALLDELKVNPENVAAAFLKLAPYFKLYSVYAYDYKQIVSILQEVHRSNPKLATFISGQETRPEVSNKLAALLIVPIQRIPRYRLLLQEVLSHTTPFQQDYYTLQNALQEVERTARHINGLVQEQENMEKMIQLQKSLHHGRPGIITPGRKFIREGILMKVSSNGRRPLPRYFILFSDMLIYCIIRSGKTPSQPGALKCCCVLPLKRCIVQPVMSQGVLRLSCHGETLILFSACVDDTKKWLEALQQALKQYHANLNTLRKDSSARRPMRRRDILNATHESPSQLVMPSNRKRPHADHDDQITSPQITISSPTPGNLLTPDTPDQRMQSCFPDCRPIKVKRLLSHFQQAPPPSVTPLKPTISYPLRSSLRTRNASSCRDERRRVTIISPRGTVSGKGSYNQDDHGNGCADKLATACQSTTREPVAESGDSSKILCDNVGALQKPSDEESSRAGNDDSGKENTVVASWSPFAGIQGIGNLVMGIHKALRRSLRRSLFRFTPELHLQ